MKSTLVIFYSHKGNNRFLAHQIASTLSCPMEELKPRLNVHLLFMMGIHMGNQKLKQELKSYDRIILCGPVWMGKFIPPLRSFLSTYRDEINELVFVSCCGSSFEDKDKRFGHGLVFNKVKEMYSKELHCEAFPITLVVPEDQREDPNTVMQTRLNEENFNGKIKEQFDRFIHFLKQ